MAVNVIEEARRNSNRRTDIVNFRNQYLTEGFRIDSPFMFELRNYVSFLKLNSKVHELKESFRYRPDYAAIEFYGDKNLEFILLLINGCRSAMDFDMSYLQVPDYSAILDVLKRIDSRIFED